MNLPLKALKDLFDFIREKNYPSELIISAEDYNRLSDKLSPQYRTPGQMPCGVTLVKARTAPPLDVSDQQLFEEHGTPAIIK